MTKTSKTCVVAGGGIAGLVAAIALARGGRQVSLFEKRARLGGRATTSVEQGFALNLGPHALFRGGVLYRTLREWGIPIPARAPVLNGGVYLVKAGRKFRFPTGAAGLMLTGALGWKGKMQAATMLKRISDGKPLPAPETTAQEWIEQSITDGGARQLMETMIRVSSYSIDLAHFSAVAAMRQVRSGISPGVLYVDGGWQTIVDRLRAYAESLGVRITTGREVSSADPGTVLALPPTAVERITGVRLPTLPAVHFASLDIALRSVVNGAAKFALGLDQPLYYSMHSATAALAPEGGGMLHVGEYLRPGTAADRTRLEAFTDLLAPSWREQAAIARFLPDLVVSNGHPVPGGRPRADVLKMPGVMVAGDWVDAPGDATMLADAATASALHAAERLLEDTWTA